jgi:excisionase family DNA binding protein
VTGPRKWYSIPEVADLLEVSRQTAQRLVRRGLIPGGALCYAYEERKGERWHVLREALDAHLAGQNRRSA